MLYRMETNLTVGGGSRGYGLGFTPNGFSLLYRSTQGSRRRPTAQGESSNSARARLCINKLAPSVGHGYDKFRALTSLESNHRYATTRCIDI